MNELNTIDIKGKAYVLVNERLKYFRAIYIGYGLISTPVHLDEKYCVFKAEIIDPRGTVVATGFAREVNGDNFINKTSYVENCETSAWGRALANFGIGVDSSVASAEEVMNAIKNQGKTGNDNGNNKGATSIIEVDTELYTSYIKEHDSALPDGFHWDLASFRKALRIAVKKKYPTAKSRENFAWTIENLTPFAKNVKASDTWVQNDTSD